MVSTLFMPLVFVEWSREYAQPALWFLSYLLLISPNSSYNCIATTIALAWDYGSCVAGWPSFSRSYPLMCLVWFNERATEVCEYSNL